ncbi:hypothetical protein BG46_24105 [Brucella anthropi]|uniref:hypothetical protein n=1 Tax=Brucella anthropi TaxID=529 RepID=UPI000451149A|nr:hypothetical protein [Brucella anthropi]EXL04850.1 hypothetical protein BG46_24105 [Brucella anthropi]
MIRSGSCEITIDGVEAGNVEFKFDTRVGRGQLWIAPESLMDALSSRDVALRIDGEDRHIIITTATPGEAAQFTFSDWQRA